MKIYTRFGDEGLTRLLGGVTTQKSDVRVEMCGELDELNAVTGLVISGGPTSEFQGRLTRVQSTLFDAGALVAAVGTGSRRESSIANFEVSGLEEEIDAMQTGLPQLTHFILPGGCATGARLHLARTVCRRAERCLVRLCESWPNETGCQSLLIYLNRLSDWLFVAARFANHCAGVPETLWNAGSKVRDQDS